MAEDQDTQAIVEALRGLLNYCEDLERRLAAAEQATRGTGLLPSLGGSSGPSAGRMQAETAIRRIGQRRIGGL